MNDQDKPEENPSAQEAPGNGAGAPEAPAPAAPEPSEADKLKEQIKELEDKLKYAAADKVNTVKRLEKEGMKTYHRGVEGVVTDLLPIQENLERAYEAKADEVQTIKDGIAMIIKEFKRLLEKYGIEEIEPKEGDALDVNIHEALVQEEHPTLDENKIVRVIKRGYRHRSDDGNHRIISAAQVVVSKKPAGGSAPHSGGADDNKADKQA